MAVVTAGSQGHPLGGPQCSVAQTRRRLKTFMTPTQEQSRAIFLEGIGHFEAGRLDEARAAFERCRALTPDRPSVLGNLGLTLFHLGQAREALPWLQQATAADPAFTDAWACLGLAHEALGHWAEAAEALTTAIGQSDRSARWRLSQGQCLMRMGRAPQALAALDRALELDPGLATAWSTRGSLLREMQRPDAAAESFERAIALGADRELHAYYLAAVRGGAASAPATAPRQYVEALFDDYADEFQGHVVQALGYRGHEVLLQPIVAAGRRFGAALDLGCGTGLCAPLLRACCDVVDGVDVSSRMLAQARRLGLYRELHHADLGDFLAAASQRAELVVAADVLIYVGELSAVFRHVARLLEPGGLFAFSVELPTNDQELQLLPSLRYAHAERYVLRLAAEHGLGVAHRHAAPIRHEQSKPVPGLYLHLRCSR
jgi:predicted TPR repeat methyltransferase